MIHQNGVSEDFPVLQLVRTGRVVRLIGRLTFIALIVSIISMVFVPWRQTAPGMGSVMALDPQQRPQSVTSPTKGVVDYVKPDLREGSYVTEGELLLKMKPISEGQVGQLETQLAQLENKLTAGRTSQTVYQQIAEQQVDAGEQMSDGLDQTIEATRNKLAQKESEVTKVRAKLKDKKFQLQVALDTRAITPGQEIFSKQQEVEAAEADVLKALDSVEETLSTLVAKEKEVAGKKQEIYNKNLEAEQKVLDAQQKVNEIQKLISELNVKQDELDRLDIKAPRSGFIYQWNGIARSDAVKEGGQLFVIVPDTDQLCVEMKVSGNDMPLIHEGDRVRLQFKGWPAVQFVGWPSVAVGTFGGKVNRVFPTDDGKGNFRVVVTPDNHFPGEKGWPDDRYLRQGVRANGWVLLKRVRIGYEIWRQLNGFPPVVADDEPKNKGSKVKLPKP